MVKHDRRITHPRDVLQRASTDDQDPFRVIRFSSRIERIAGHDQSGGIVTPIENSQ
ncbi:hypothetical protein GS429_03380 [Natronorubrum sp. JWXQ-INN-674]|uniref:Uncharacterized protein n=1 Tax=Natronorubrum halalkaliphilum TaxID=2691917 RepID=A0A6B0VJ60_9EURY|nr:hypothetical protein [Natronorubrum halalkaliphilum]MXV61115.1 hypothetical protein [Natronorubrum halalkaliphilum]